MKIHRSYWLSGIALATMLSGCAVMNWGGKHAVESRLAKDPVVHAQKIDVKSAPGGVVTLQGNIDSQEAKERAVSLARETDGVTRVNDMIAVRTGPNDARVPSGKDDHVISSEVKKRLDGDPIVKDSKIDVDTRQGVVFLTGEVSTELERDQAIRIAKHTEGVREVEANIRLGSG